MITGSSRSRRSARWLALAFAMAVLPLAASPPARAATEIKLPLPVTETLPNGMQLVWFVNDNLPVVDLELVLASGERDDPAGKTGTSALVAETLERGAGGMNARQIARAIERLGASHYVSADDDTFSVGMHGLAPDAPTLLDLLGKLVLKPEFPPAEVAREHARLLDRWSHVSDYSDSLATLLYERVISAGTTYGRGGFLSPGEFNHVTRKDVEEYYRRNFTPHNAILVIVGRVDQPQLRSKIETIFGSWRGAAPVHRYVKFADRRLPNATLLRRRRGHSRPPVLVVDRPDLTQAQIRMGFDAPLIQDPRHYALTLANAMLGEYFNSRLNALIRDKLGLTYGIESSYTYDKDLGTFTVSTATGTETVGQLIQRTFTVLTNFRSGPIPDDEVKMAKDYLIGSFPLRTDTLEAVATGWLTARLFGLPSDYLNQFVSRISAVTPAEVLSAVKQTFDVDHMTVVVAGEAAGIERSLKDAGIPSRRIPVRLLLSGRSVKGSSPVR